MEIGVNLASVLNNIMSSIIFLICMYGIYKLLKD